MLRSIVAATACAMLCACSTAGVVNRAAFMQMQPGMTRDAVIATMGEPGNRTFRDESEALQYCRTGMMTDEYFTVWLVRGVVRAVSTENAYIAEGSCGGRYPTMDWSKAPSEVRVAITSDD